MAVKTNIVNFSSFNSLNLSVVYCDNTNIAVDKEPPLHIHDTFEIYLNLSGDVSFVVENRTYPISRGNMIITKPYEYHHCIFHDNKEHDHYCIQISGNDTDEILAVLANREKGKNNHIVLDGALTASIIKHFEKLLNCTYEPSIDKYYHLIRILQIIENSCSDAELDFSEDIPEKLREVLNIIATRYAEPLTIASLASEVFVSVNTLERYFKRYLNITPGEYIKRKRLSEAMLHLNNNTSVSDVAMRCGFSDTSNFIQIFKRTFGQTPYQYLKNKK